MNAIGALKRHFPGVKGRLVDLCRPSQQRYNLAVTVAGGKDMDAIVVDGKKTAFDCIKYLRGELDLNRYDLSDWHRSSMSFFAGLSSHN